MDGSLYGTCRADVNIGFLAIAYTSGALILIDMRGPRVMLREGSDPKSHRRRSSTLLHHSGTDSVVKCMKWVYCGLEEGERNEASPYELIRLNVSVQDSTPKLRLLASSASGSTRAYSLSRAPSSGLWTISGDVKKIDGIEEPIRRASFVINSKTGTPCNAGQASLVEAMSASGATPGSPTAGTSHCFCVFIGARGAKCSENLSGRRVGRVEWGKNRTIETAEVVYRSGKFFAT